MKSKIEIAILFVCLIQACGHRVTDAIVFPDEEKTIVAAKVHTEKVLLPDFVTIVENHLIVASSRTDSMLFVYSTPDLTLQNVSGKKGKGPGEFSAFPMFCFSPTSKYLYIWGHNVFTIRKCQLDAGGNIFPLEDFSMDKFEEFNCMHIVRDSILIYFLIDELTIKKYDLKNGKALGELKIEKESHRESFFYANRGQMIANDSCIIYAYLFKNQIDIYDMETFSLKRRLKGDGKQKLIFGDFDNSIYHYTNLVAGEHYFYALYQGRTLADYSKDVNSIEMFDYDGNPIQRVQLNPSPVAFAVDEREKFIYGYDYKLEDYLLIYDMNDL